MVRPIDLRGDSFLGLHSSRTALVPSASEQTDFDARPQHFSLKLRMTTGTRRDEPLSEVIYSNPQTREQVINTYFQEHRAKLLDVAAFLDRIERAKPTANEPDFRQAALLQAIGILTDGHPHRAKRILELLSDHSTELPQSAHGMKGAAGAVRLAAATPAASSGKGDA